MTLLPTTSNLTPEAGTAKRQESKRDILEILKDAQTPYARKIDEVIKQKYPGFTTQYIASLWRRSLAAESILRLLSQEIIGHGEESELLDRNKQYAVKKLKRANSPSQRSESEKPVIASSAKPAATQHEPAQPAGAIQTKRRRVLSLKKRTSLREDQQPSTRVRRHSE